MRDPETIATYEAVAEEYRRRHADRSDVADAVAAFLDALDAARSDAAADEHPRVLDVGCGPGWESATFAKSGCDVLGIDLTQAFLEAAAGETAPTAEFARMDMQRLGLAASSVDGLWACASFLHVPRSSAPATLSGFHRVLAEDGVLALLVKRGTGRRAGDAYEDDERTFVLYEAEGLRSLVEDAGFDVTKLQTTEDWLFLLGTV